MAEESASLDAVALSFSPISEMDEDLAYQQTKYGRNESDDERCHTEGLQLDLDQSPLHLTIFLYRLFPSFELSTPNSKYLITSPLSPTSLINIT